MKKQLFSIITILTLVLTAFTPTSVFANNTSEPDLCTDGGEHEIEEWIPIEIHELVPSTVVYPNPPDLDTRRNITVARRCKKCGKIFETAKEYEVIHHPTCQEDGYTQYTDRFGKVTTSDIIKAGPDYHSFGPIVSLGTTTETQDNGIIIETERIGRMCVFCHEEEVKETKVRKITKPATCTEDGCEETIDENGNRSRVNIPSEGHKWGRSSKTETTYDESKEMTTEKTRSICETCGQLRTCTHCIWHEQPTCTEIGKWYESYNDDSEDSGGAIHVFKEEPAAGHKWSAWETSVNPTTEKEGEKVRECTVCHEKETEKIPKLKTPADNNKKQSVPETTQQPTKGTTQKVTKEQGDKVTRRSRKARRTKSKQKFHRRMPQTRS